MIRIHCPYCGVRDHEEFSYFGDATKTYPPLEAEHQNGWVEAVFMRDNPKGLHTEFWQHTLACRRWLAVTRSTMTHDIVAVVPARERPLA
jgi:sarcosine oxidase subunit delta